MRRLVCSHRPALRLLVAALSLATGLLALGACGSPRPTYPVNYSFASAIAYTLAHGGQPPLGANDWNCKPTPAHPYPVVLVHGTFANMTNSWEALSPQLANAGYCVFALNYGGSPPSSSFQATGDIAKSAQQLAAFVDQVRAATGVSKVDVVGHSQGGMMPRYYLNFLGGAAKVHTLVGLAPSNHGSTFFGLTKLATVFGASASVPGCAACGQQVAGSDFLTHLNGMETVPGVNYTVIETKYDDVVTPHTSAFLNRPGVSNITLQSGCPIDLADHLAIIYDRRALTQAQNALQPGAPLPVPCTLVLPVNGG